MIASVVDQKVVRGTLVAALFLAYVLLGIPALVLVNDGMRDPWLMILGIAGLAGLFGAGARLRLGPRYFLATKKLRLFILSCLVIGASAAFVASFIARSMLGPDFAFLAKSSWIAGALGLSLVVASIKSGA